MKQFQLMHNNGFTLAEREAMKPIIYSNVIDGLATLLKEKLFLGIVPMDFTCEVHLSLQSSKK